MFENFYDSCMDLTQSAYGTWSGGRFMHFGKTLSEQEFISNLRGAYDKGVRTFVTADVYGTKRADQLFGRAFEDIPRDSYALVGMIGHDFINGERQGSKGYPRFTDPTLRESKDYTSFLTEATHSSLADCKTDYFDLLMIHNPDEIGYISEEVWSGMDKIKQSGITQKIGIAPGPANGFVLDMIHVMETFGEVIDWSMLILNPFEPWPAGLILPAAEENNVDIITRVVDYGGLFHGQLKTGYKFKPGDHRSFRPEGWIDAGVEKLSKLQPILDKHNITPLQLSCLWNLSQPAVKSVIPTYTQEEYEGAKPILEQVAETIDMPNITFDADDLALIHELGDNTGCMKLKGASQRHETSERPDEWPMRPELLELAERRNLGSSWSY